MSTFYPERWNVYLACVCLLTVIAGLDGISTWFLPLALLKMEVPSWIHWLPFLLAAITYAGLRKSKSGKSDVTVKNKPHLFVCRMALLLFIYLISFICLDRLHNEVEFLVVSSKLSSTEKKNIEAQVGFQIAQESGASDAWKIYFIKSDGNRDKLKKVLQALSIKML